MIIRPALHRDALPWLTARGGNLAQTSKCLLSLLPLSWSPPGEIVLVQHVFSAFGTIQRHIVGQRHDLPRRAGVELSPVPYVLFRPEEVVLRSTMRETASDGSDSVSVTNDGGRIGRENLTISHVNDDALMTIKTWTVNTHDLAREQPADCQRFSPSAPEPFLLTFHSNAILRGNVGER